MAAAAAASALTAVLAYIVAASVAADVLVAAGTAVAAVVKEYLNKKHEKEIMRVKHKSLNKKITN